MASRTARFDPSPTTEAGYESARRHLRDRFRDWSATTGARWGPDSFDQIIHYKWGYLDGHLTLWARADLDEVLLELFPAKVIVDDDQMETVLPEAVTFIRFLAETGLLDPESEDPEALCDHLERLGPRFRRHMADVSRHSFGKRFWLAAMAEGVRPDDDQAVSAFIERFNARTMAEREAVLGRRPRATPGWVAAGRFTPPGTQPRRRPNSTDRRRRRR